MYKLRATTDHPFFHHISELCELQHCIKKFKEQELPNRTLSKSNVLKTYHFNIMRAILEKTSVFFGLDKFSKCLEGIDNRELYARLLNIMSHGGYSVYEPIGMVRDNAELFVQLFEDFQRKYHFELPEDLV